MMLGSRLAFVLALAACGAPPDAFSNTPDGPRVPLVVSDRTADSPALAEAPFGGGTSWGFSDKYASGIALVDLDGDDALDLVHARNDRDDPSMRSVRFYRGTGDGRFEDATTVGWDDSKNGTVALAFDYDGDDDLDVMIGVDGAPSVLYRNDGEFQFTDVSADAGLDGYADRVFTAAAGDVDADGDLDLYLGAWEGDDEDGDGEGESPNRMLINLGDGRFVDRTTTAGVDCYGRSTLGIAMVDLDNDSDLDIYVANDFFDDCVFENDGAGVFVDVGADAGVYGATGAGMGVGIGDLDGNGLLDVFVTDTQVYDESPGNAVFLNDGDLQFRSVARDLELDGLISIAADWGNDWIVCWGVGLVDLDSDGDLDVHVTTGTDRPELLWRNDGGVFSFARDLILGLAQIDGRGSSYGDIDGDGDIDIAIARRRAPIQILRNDTRQVGGQIVVRVEPLSAAPGARVELTADGRTQVAAIQAGQGYISTSPPEARFGLGPATTARVDVYLVGGGHVSVDDVAVGSVVTVRAPRVAEGLAPGS